MKILQDRLEPSASDSAPPRGRRLAILSLTALGVVFGDIGTSPLYALRECFHGAFKVGLSPANIMGVLSLIFWSLVLVISVKYLVYVMRADNKGEGGILALMALIHPARDEEGGPRRRLLVVLGLFGAALLYGDGTITPAISVLSAVEGLRVAAPHLDAWIIPIAIAILVGLFAFQSRGTGRVGGVFGPVMVVWFLLLIALGLRGIARAPEVLQAVDPRYAVDFFAANGRAGYFLLGAVFLVVTGGEALYADMGHFGRLPIRLAWYAFVLPALLVNYFGQGALLLADPGAVASPFYHLVPGWALYPLVVMATAATVIASQAVISGSFSLTRQAIQLGYCPRLRIEHTSQEEIGQVYLPAVNWVLMVLTIGLVLGFRHSSHLAAAYGVAVTTTMVITTLLAFAVARETWRWPWWAAVGVTAFFLVPDLAFFGANMNKLASGGWFPLCLGLIVFAAMWTWHQGKERIGARLRSEGRSFDDLLAEIKADPPRKVPGAAVFLTANTHLAPPALIHQLEHFKVLHETVVLMTFRSRSFPYVPAAERVKVQEVEPGIYRVLATFGFMQEPWVPQVLRRCADQGLVIDINEASFFLGREMGVPPRRGLRRRLQSGLFDVLTRNAPPAYQYFHIPPERVIELGVRVQL